MACNHSFRTIIGLSCKYLIRGLGEWGGWEGLASEASWLLLSLEAQRRHWGPLRQWPEEEGSSQAASGPLELWPPGWSWGWRISARREFSSYQSLMGTNCPSPSSPLHAQQNVFISTQMTHRCVSRSPLSFSPHRAWVARVLPLL